MSRTRIVALVALLSLPVAAGGFMLQQREARDGARLFDQVFSLVSARFVDSLPSDEIYERAARGLLAQLNDPYAALVTPRELEAFTVETAGRYGGIGLLIEDHEGKPTISKVFPGTPGEAAGIQPGDVVLGVNGESTSGWAFQRVTGTLKGEPGSRVSVELGRAGVNRPIRLDLVRAVIRIPSVPFALMLDHHVGYIPLQQFSERSLEEVQQALLRLEREGMQSLILDLRGNGGGYTDQATGIANLFLRSGQEIYSVRSRDGTVERHLATRAPVAPTLPLVLLTDGFSASATEIVAGALQDHDRALVLGTTSFGKGLVQTVYPLDGGYVVKFTTGKWFTPSGRSIQRPDRDVGSARAEAPDTSEDAIANRPAYHSDAGRIVYGGGAITPDVIVKSDTMTTAEQALARLIAPRSQDAYLALYDLAEGLKGRVRPDFAIQPAWRDQLYRRLSERGVTIGKAEWEAGQGYVDRLIRHRVAVMAFGDSTARRRSLPDDAPLRTALALVAGHPSQEQLLASAGGEN